ncbi:RNA 3'-terminal phosphate cyclase [Zavarzinia sp. CC-PAN008]|uniref:RNA 3'-terminal phosphate cyclase n=1 Tax=Zavarzinia sp. CC-PAN008 TaxID=3243332 RepID=UPI003F745ECD
MIVIDGSEGEGGGQVVRNALALSLVTGQPFRITSIRGRRPKPGLMRQHLTAVEAACAIGGGTCDGAAVNATEITFRPGRVRAGDYHFAVGTAGSTGLVLQTILLPLALADGPSRLVLEGGTHNDMAPPFDFLERVFLPVVNRMGPCVEARLVRHGFHPRGGGRIEVAITPAPLRRVECTARGPLVSVAATALFAALPFDIAERELKAARTILDWPEDAFRVRQLPGDQGPGTVLLLEAQFAHGAEIVTGFGRFGTPAHQLARKAARRMAGYIAAGAFAGPFLADQLLLPLALAGGGAFTTVKPSQHSRTAADIIARFTGRHWHFVPQADGTHLVSLA